MYRLNNEFLESLKLRKIAFINGGKLKEEYGKLFYFYINEKEVEYDYKDLNDYSVICCSNPDIEVSGKLFNYFLKNRINLVFIINDHIYEYGTIDKGRNIIDYSNIRLEISKLQGLIVLRKRRRLLQKAKTKNVDFTEEDYKNYNKYHNQAVQQLKKCESSKEINGVLGFISRLYYEKFDKLFCQGMDWQGKTKYSIGSICLKYLENLLENHIIIVLLANGINEKISISRHSENHRKGALVQDLKFELAPILVDSVLFKVFNLKILRLSDFENWDYSELPKIVKQKLSEAFHKKLEMEFTYPGSTQKVSYTELIAIQALQIYKISLGELDSYNPIDLK